MSAPSVLLLGDAAVDLFLLPDETGQRVGSIQHENWRNFAGWQLWRLPGGAALTLSFMKSLGLAVDAVVPQGDGALPRSLAELARDPQDPSALRVMGFRGYAMGDGARAPFRIPMRAERKDYDLLVLDDPGNRLRAETELWKPHLLPLCAPVVVHKCHMPLASGRLWECLADRNTGRHLLVVPAEDLRRQGIDLSRRLSWDRTLEDLRNSLRRDDHSGELIRSLTRVADWLVVVFDCDAVALISKNSNTPDRIDLFYDPSSAEGDHQAGSPGRIAGRLTCFTAHLVAHVAPRAAQLAADDVRDAVSTALTGLRKYAHAPMSVTKGRLKYPCLFPVLEQQNTLAHHVLEDIHGTKRISIVSEMGDLVDKARSVVRHGLSELRDVPSARFRDFVTVDRNEIEGYRSIADLMRRHANDIRAKRPLSIAVFGPPGAGKSFGVKQIAPPYPKPLEFNLSQIKSHELPGFFHEIRDQVLAGHRPLCFFDEFDSQDLKLLSSFLAPMQDGEFRDGTRLHPIGPAIFVFAGGVAQNIAQFREMVDREDMRSLKGMDFLSRLSGYIDVRGPDPNGSKLDDPAHVLRRAVLLRSLLANSKWRLTDEQGVLSIEDSVLDAFLTVERFQHGARSIQRLIEMSELETTSTRLSLADLPFSDQLGLHVDPEDFEARLRAGST